MKFSVLTPISNHHATSAASPTAIASKHHPGFGMDSGIAALPFDSRLGIAVVAGVQSSFARTETWCDENRLFVEKHRKSGAQWWHGSACTLLPEQKREIEVNA